MILITEKIRQIIQAANKVACGIIEYETKSHYGGPELIYVTSKHKDPLTVLTGTKTITDRHKKALEDLGFEFKRKI